MSKKIIKKNVNKNWPVLPGPGTGWHGTARFARARHGPARGHPEPLSKAYAPTPCKPFHDKSKAFNLSCTLMKFPKAIPDFCDAPSPQPLRPRPSKSKHW